MRILIITFLLISNISWAVIDSGCATVDGDIIACLEELHPIEGGLFQSFEDVTKMHQFMMNASLEYRTAYIEQSKNGDRSVELIINENGDLTITHNGNGSTGGMIGKSIEEIFHNGNGSTGGMIGKGIEELFHNGNGSTGGMIGKPKY